MKIAIAICCMLILTEEVSEFFYKKKIDWAPYRFKKMSSDIEICNIGSGPGLFAISYKNYSQRGFNMSTVPQSFFYGYKLLKNYSGKIKRGAIIIIIIMCPLSFGDNQSYYQKKYADIYYGILPPKEIEHYSFLRALMIAHPLLCRVISKMRRILREVFRSGAVSETTNQEPRIITDWKSQFCLRDLKDASQAEAHRKAFNEKIAILTEEIRYCYVNGWRPILVTPPLPKGTRAYIGNDFMERFVYDHLSVLQESYPDLQLLDYYSDERFTDKMFQNDIFMNELGRSAFSEILFRDIETKIYRRRQKS